MISNFLNFLQKYRGFFYMLEARQRMMQCNPGTTKVGTPAALQTPYEATTYPVVEEVTERRPKAEIQREECLLFEISGTDDV